MLLILEAVPMVTLASYPNTNVVSTQASKQASVTVCAIIFYFKIFLITRLFRRVDAANLHCNGNH